jgi:hypothetical protein
MKKQEYLTLVDSDFEYVFSNESLEDEYLEGGDGDVFGPSIKMSVETASKDIDAFLSHFSFVDCNGENPDFLRHYKQTLRGENTLWKITSIKISHQYMWVTFYNEELYRLRCEGNAKDENLPYYSECAELNWFGKNECDYADMRFEIQYPESSCTETILVCFSTYGNTVITEFGEHKRREILLPGVKVPLLGDTFRMICTKEYRR